MRVSRVLFDDGNNKLVCIDVENSTYFEAIAQSNCRKVVLGIVPNEFDKLAIAWRKRLMLNI
jgi:hypothetical protein